MGLSRAFTQAATATALVAANQFPNNATITDATLGTTPSIILPARPNLNRRGLVIENDSSSPMIFAFGTTVSFSQRTALLFSNDVYEDLSGWQGAVAAASVGGSGAANFTEMVFI
jgi:hypothetical protein